MKIKFKSLLVLAAGLTFITACKKSASTTGDPQLTPAQVTSQVALNLNSSLFGGMGAVDASQGINSAQSFAIHTKGKTINDLGSLGCGLTADTTFTTTASLGTDSTLTVAETLNFSFLCTNNQFSGFNTNDNLSITYTGPNLTFAYKVAENLTFAAVNITDPNTETAIKGTLGSNGSYQFKTGTKRSGTEVFTYTITSLLIDASGNTVSGSATFSSSGSGPRGVWNVQGSITFLGGSKATVAISGKVYNVDLNTGITS